MTPAMLRFPVNGMTGLFGKGTIGAALAVTLPMPEPEVGDNEMD